MVVKQTEGTLVCKECGVVNKSQMIDQKIEKFNFTSELAGADASGGRVNAVSIAFGGGSATMRVGGSANDKTQNKQNFPHMTAMEKNITDGRIRINQLATSLLLSQSVKSLAVTYLQKVEESKALKGRSLDAKVAVVILIASRTEN